MGKKFKDVPAPKGRAIISTLVPMNKMKEVSVERKGALPSFAVEARDKEYKLRISNGPHSLPAPWYEKSFKIKKEE